MVEKTRNQVVAQAARGFESHPIRQKSPANSRGCWTFLFAQILKFPNSCVRIARFRVRTAYFLVENRVQIRFCYLALLGYIFPAAPKIIRPRKKHSLLPCLRRGYWGSVVEMGITVDEGSTGGYVAFQLRS